MFSPYLGLKDRTRDGVALFEKMNVPDATSKVLQLNNKQIDFAWDIPIAAKDSLTKDLRQFIIRVGGANTVYVNMNPTGKAGAKFADARVRQAMSLALDRQAVADTAFLGLVKPLTSFWYDCPDICTPGMLPNGGKLRKGFVTSGWYAPVCCCTGRC